MNILYLHQYFNTPSMPGSTRSYEMARRLVASGHTVRVVTSWREASASSSWFMTDEDGIEVHWMPVPYGNEMSYPDRIRAFFRFAWGAARRAAALEGDVVLATSTPLTIALPGAYAARRRKVPMVFEVRDLWPEMPIAMGALRNPSAIRAARWLERFAYKSSSRVVALSPGMADGVAATGFPRARITVIPNSCDFDLFGTDPDMADAFLAERPELGDGPIVLYPGTIGRVNGVQYLVHLAKAMETEVPDARFVILGAGSEEPAVRTLAEEVGVLGRTLFMYRPLPKVEVVGAFAAADLVISLVTDVREVEINSANKFFDALAARRAIAVNYGGWQAELIRDHGAGLRLSHDIDQAAVELTTWLRDPDRPVQDGTSAFELGKDRFDRDRLADQLASVLVAAVDEAAAARA